MPSVDRLYIARVCTLVNARLSLSVRPREIYRHETVVLVLSWC